MVMQVTAVLLSWVAIVGAAAPSGAATATDLPDAVTTWFTGAWTGEWTPANGGRPQPAELVVTPTTTAGRIVGQFTFLSGAQSWTSRHEGRVADGVARFELAGDGTMVLRPTKSGELRGEFTAPSGRLPATVGSLTLQRAR